MTTTDLPTPKYRIGQTVWHPQIDRSVEALPCPDCMGAKKWKVVTPAGLEMETPCQRCALSYGRIADLPRPERVVFKASARQLTIGGVRAGTPGMSHYGDNGIEYMCQETGVGSGTVYTEDKLHETEETALAVATIQAGEQTEKVAAQPDQMEARRLDNLTIECAVAKDAHSAKWNAWYAYRRLAEEVQDALDDKGLTAAERLEAIGEHLDWDTRHRDLPDIGKALERLRALCPATPEAAEVFKALMLPGPAEDPSAWLAAE